MALSTEPAPQDRLVVVISAKYLNELRGAANVVPLEMLREGVGVTRNPVRNLQNVPLEKPYYWADKDRRVWALCEEMQLLSLEHFELIHRADPKYTGKNVLPVPTISRDDLRRIRLGVLHVIDVPKDAIRKPILQRYRDYIKSFRSKSTASRRGKKRR